MPRRSGGGSSPEVWPAAADVWGEVRAVGLRNLGSESRSEAWVDVARLVVMRAEAVYDWNYDLEITARSMSPSGLGGRMHRRRSGESPDEWEARVVAYSGELAASWPAVREGGRAGDSCLGCAGELERGYWCCGVCVYYGLAWRSNWVNAWDRPRVAQAR